MTNPSNQPRTHSPEELLAQSDWVRRLAGRLVTDPHLADDLAQDTLVAALQHQGAPRRSLKAWLSCVLLNMIRDAHRREQRRLRREAQSAGGGKVPSTLDVVERAATHSTVVQAVLGLNEPYRSVILMRFFDDLAPRKIARRLDVAVSTVNTRLQRGLDRLRVELDRNHGQDHATWRRALLLLLSPPVKLPAAAGISMVLVKGAAWLGIVAILSVAVLKLTTPQNTSRLDSVDTAARTRSHPAPGSKRPPTGIPTVVTNDSEFQSKGSPSSSTPPDPSPDPEDRKYTPLDRISPDSTGQQPPPGMLLIPGGEAVLGLSEAEIQELGLQKMSVLNLLAASTPRRIEQIAPFYLDKTEVTQGQWQVYLDSTDKSADKTLIQFAWPTGRVPEQHREQPLALVSYREAMEFAHWVGKRLPTETEWEYAARGPEGRFYPWGQELEAHRARFSESSPDGTQGAVEVGSLPEGASAFGVLDMAGNLWEWTSSALLAYDGYEDLQISTRYTRGRPARYSAISLFDEHLRVIRGGSWDAGPVALLSALRQGTVPATWNTTIGFRCARSIRSGQDLIVHSVSKIARQTSQALTLDWDTLLSYGPSQRGPQDAIDADARIAFVPSSSRRLPLRPPFRDSARLSFLGLLVSTGPLLSPPLPAGLYLLLHQKRTTSHAFPTTGTDRGWQVPPAVPSGVFFDPTLDHLLLLNPEGVDVAYRAVHLHPRAVASHAAVLNVGRGADGRLLKLDFAFPNRTGETDRPPFRLPIWIDRESFEHD